MIADAKPPSPPTPVPAPPAVPTTARHLLLIAGHMFDSRTGKVLAHQAIAIENDKIVAVVDASAAVRRPDQTVIEIPGGTVLPGLIDMHTHLTSDPQYIGMEGLRISAAREALIGAKNAKVTLEAGFTTVRNVGAGAYSDVALRDAIDAREIPGPRVVASGPAMSITGGHCDLNLLTHEYQYNEPLGVADGVPAVQHKVREIIKFGSDVIKVCATGGYMSPNDDPKASQYSLEELKALVADSHRLGRRVAAHAHGAEGIVLSVLAGVDSIEHGTFIDDRGIKLMKEHGTWLVPTLYWDKEDFDKQVAAGRVPNEVAEKSKNIDKEGLENRARAFKGGVKFAFGTDAGVYPHGKNAKEFPLLVSIGMTPAQALQSATIHAAELLGWSDRVGAIAPGRWADIIVVDGDPLQDMAAMERVRFVMKNGIVFKNEIAAIH